MEENIGRRFEIPSKRMREKRVLHVLHTRITVIYAPKELGEQNIERDLVGAIGFLTFASARSNTRKTRRKGRYNA